MCNDYCWNGRIFAAQRDWKLTSPTFSWPILPQVGLDMRSGDATPAAVAKAGVGRHAHIVLHSLSLSVSSQYGGGVC